MELPRRNKYYIPFCTRQSILSSPIKWNFAGTQTGRQAGRQADSEFKILYISINDYFDKKCSVFKTKNIAYLFMTVLHVM
jgi:hypothetical protein